MTTEVTRESVLALMPNKTLTVIDGEPTHKAVKKLEKELGANLIAVACPFGHGKGHLGILQPDAIFFQRNGAHFVPPANAPPAYPVIPPGSTTAEREQLRAENTIAKNAWQTFLHVKRIAVNQAAAAIDSVYYAELDDPDEGLNDVEIRDLIDHVRDRYCAISQDEIDKNLLVFGTGIDPSLPLAVYTRKQETCQEFAQDANVPISEETMVTTATKHALQCGGLTQAWREWRRTVVADQTWPNWKTHWTTAFNEQRDITKLTGTDFQGHANSAREDELSERMVASLDNLANAAVQKNDTVEKLVISNKTLTDTVATLTNDITRLTTAIAALKANKSTKAPQACDPNGYCWTHSFKVKFGHSSKMCTKRKEGHKEDAMRSNTMGGSEWGKPN